MDKEIPHSWIGRGLVLSRADSANWELITLKQVSDLGVAYTYAEGEIEGEPVFVPWHSISWIRPPVPEDLQNTEPE
ncbi:MAG: hypothetical protein ACRDSJ_05655 [Rubrobacteraceae bacterium]